MNKKATVITATALSIPLLVGCSQADTEATATPAADSSNGTSSPEAQTTHGSGAVIPSPATDSAAPSTGKASYALYQSGQPVGYVGTDADGTEVSFGPSPALGGQTWELNNGSNVDKYGNVYLSYDKGVTVLTPTEAGFDSKRSAER